MRMPGMGELVILALLFVAATAWGLWYVARLAKRGIEAREQLLARELERREREARRRGA